MSDSFFVKETTYIIIHETPLDSWLRDAGTFVLFLCCIGVGVLLNSSAMQWAGFFVAFILLLSHAPSQQTKRLTKEQAIHFLQGGEQ